MTDALQRKMDTRTRYDAFEVVPDHPAYAVDYCPMCGGGVDRKGDCVVGMKDAVSQDAISIVIKLCQWAAYKSTQKMMRCVALKILYPSYTVRDIQGTIEGVSKTEVSNYLNDAARILPGLRVVLGFDGAMSKSQKKRRQNERICE